MMVRVSISARGSSYILAITDRFVGVKLVVANQAMALALPHLDNATPKLSLMNKGASTQRWPFRRCQTADAGYHFRSALHARYYLCCPSWIFARGRLIRSASFTFRIS